MRGSAGNPELHYQYVRGGSLDENPRKDERRKEPWINSRRKALGRGGEIQSGYKKGGRKGEVCHSTMRNLSSCSASLLCDSHNTVNKSPVLLTHDHGLLINIVILDY